MTDLLFRSIFFIFYSFFFVHSFCFRLVSWYCFILLFVATCHVNSEKRKTKGKKKSKMKNCECWELNFYSWIRWMSLSIDYIKSQLYSSEWKIKLWYGEIKQHITQMSHRFYNQQILKLFTCLQCSICYSI